MARHFVVGHVGARPGNQRFIRHRAARAQHHAGAADFAHALIGDADHGDLGDVWVLSHQALNLCRIAVEAADDEHVFEPVGNAQIAALVEHADVAGVQPAVGVNRFQRRRFVVKVTLHHVVAAQQHLARLAGGDGVAVFIDAAHLGAGHGAAAGGGDGLGTVAGVTNGGTAAALGQAVGGGDVGNAQFFTHPRNQHRRHRGRASDGHAQRRNVEILQARVRQHGQKQRRRPRQKADAVVGDARQHLVGVKHLLRVDRGTLDKRRHPAGLVAKRVEKRVDDQVTVAGLQANHAPPDAERPNRWPVRRHHPLGAAGGAGGKHQVSSAVSRERLLACLDLRRWHLRADGQKVVPRHIARVAGVGHKATAQHHDVLQRRRALAVQLRRKVLPQKVANAKQQLGAAALQNVGRFAALHAGVERHQHRASGVRTAGGHNPLVQIRCPQRDAVAGLHAQRNQRARHGLAVLQQLGIGDGGVTVNDGRLLWVLLRRLAQQRWQRLGQISRQCPRGVVRDSRSGSVRRVRNQAHGRYRCVIREI